MKKFLSLALALLMMLPLAVGTSAAGPRDVMTADEFLDILDYWKYVNNKEDYDDLLDYIYHGKYSPDYWEDYYGLDREWGNKCEQENCDGWAFFYVSRGKIYYNCSKCNTTAALSKLNGDTDTTCKDCHKNPCDCDDVDPGFIISPEVEFGWKINHGSRYCDDDDVTFSKYGKTIYWYCDNCERYGKFGESAWFDKWYGDYFWDHELRVNSTRGGTYEINGSKYVDDGDTRTITFAPNKNYVVYNVIVNGVEYGPVSKVTLTITEDTYVDVEFVKVSSLKPRTLTAAASGNGTITAKKNGVKVAADKITANYNDTVVYTFTPASSNYKVKSVTVNGRSVGKVNSYSLTTGITKDVDIKVTFEWKNPYDDLSDTYLKAVEYVTEAGIMGYYNKYVNKNAFCGSNLISVKNLAAALAEMADVNEKLDTVDERIEWAAANALIDASANLNVACTVQTACTIVNDYLALIEDAADVDFDDFDDDDTAKENALSIGLVTSTTYTNNRNLTRYDLASICYLLANLDVE